MERSLKGWRCSRKAHFQVCVCVCVCVCVFVHMCVDNLDGNTVGERHILSVRVQVCTCICVQEWVGVILCVCVCIILVHYLQCVCTKDCRVVLVLPQALTANKLLGQNSSREQWEEIETIHTWPKGVNTTVYTITASAPQTT